MKMLRINSKNIVSSYTYIDIIKFKSMLFEKLSELESFDTTKFHIEYLLNRFFDDKQHTKLFTEHNLMDKYYLLTLFLSNKIQKDIAVTIYDILLLFDTSNQSTLSFDYNTVKTLALFIVKYYREFSDKLRISKEEQLAQCLKGGEETDDAKSVNCDVLFDDPVPLDFERKLKTKEMRNLYEIIKKINNAAKERAEKAKKKMKPRFPEAFKKICQFTSSLNTMSFEVPNDPEVNVLFYLITLLNLQMFFPFISNLKFNFNFPYLYSQYFNIKNKHFNCVDIDHFYTYQDEVQITELIKANQSIFELILLIPLFTNLLQNELKSLELNIPDSFTYELTHLLKAKKVNHKDFNFLPNFDKEFSTMNISFNALNSSIFERIFVLINGSNVIKRLRLDLFPDDKYISMYTMLKCLRDSAIAVPGETKLNSAYVIDNNELVTGMLFSPFESNLEYFVFLIERKLHLFIELEFKFDLPGIFFLNDKFINTLHKFILSLFRMMYQKGKETKLLKLVITSTNFIFGTRKYPSINSFIQENINLTESKSIKEVRLEMRFHQITSIHFLIPCGVEVLSVGEMDCETLKAFNKALPSLVCLKELHMTFSGLYYNSNDKGALIEEVLTIKKSSNLRLITLYLLFDSDIVFYEKLVKCIKEVFAKSTGLIHRLFIKSGGGIEGNSVYSKAKRRDFYAVAFALKKRKACSVELLKTMFGFLSDKPILHTKILFSD